MLDRAKKHPTEVIVKSKDGVETYRIPKKAEAEVLSFLKAFKAKRVPWREAFSEELSKFSEPGLALRGARQKEKFTQKELAQKMGIEQSHISQMEHGKRSIGKAMAKKFSKILKIDYRVFL